MRRRLTLAMLLVVAAALVLAGAGTVLLARVGTRQAAEDELRRQAESTANLVSMAQNANGQLSTVDLNALRSLICNQTPNPNTTTTTRARVAGPDAALCASALDDGVAQARAQLCNESARWLEQAETPAMRQARDAFCADPSPANLERIRTMYCTADPAGGDLARRRRVEQARTGVCRMVNARQQNRSQLRTTLQNESIELVLFTPDNQLAQGELPGDLSPQALQPDRLRAGETMSGPVGDGFYAAAAVNPNAATLAAIVIARPSDPTGVLLPWLLLASGVTMLIGVIVASSLSRKLTQPLREATAATARIAAGDLSVRLAPHPDEPGRTRRAPDEFDELADAINRLAETLERSRGLERQFLLSVSHDLRTPLTSIRGYAEAIADGAVPDAPEAANIILAESRRLDRLVGDLLDLAKLDARRFTFHVVAVDLDEIASDSVDGFRREVESAGLSLSLVSAPEAMTAYADPDRLQQVIANLIENALKFAATTIAVEVVADPRGPRIEVADDGPGIAAEDLPFVFERLYVAAAQPRRRETGSGLGLAIARELAEGMGGRVDATTNPGGGARLVVQLPTEPPPLPPPPPS